MAPPPKRKRGYQQDGNDGSSRASPHRPQDLSLAQHGGHGGYGQPQQQGQNTHGGRRGGRSGPFRGGQNGERNGSGLNNGLSSAQRDGVVDAKGIGTAASRSETPVPSGQGPSTPLPMQRQETLVSATRGPSTPMPTQRPSTPSKPAPSQPMEPPKHPAPYDFEILTDECLGSWAETGRVSVVTAATEALQAQEVVQVCRTFQELIRAGLDDKIDAAEAGRTVEEILAKAPADEAGESATLFLDTVSVMTESEVTHPRIPTLVKSTGITLALMREQLEEPMLQALGLVRQTFGKMFIRKQTSNLYRQSNYNLLREEPEGYSKLVTELFTTTDNEPPTAEVVEETFENIKALIGTFDLDAGRVLDVTLDVFGSLLVKHYRFFVKLLRASSWWPQDQSVDGLVVEDTRFGGLPPWAQPGHSSWLASEEDKERMGTLKEERDTLFWNRARSIGMDAYFELGGRRVLGDAEIAEHTATPGQADDLRDAEIAETRNWIKSTRTLPPLGNAVAAQLLGFKLRFYASQARNIDDNLPGNLIYLAALLIKIGFISLRDLYPHLHPVDDAMEAVREVQMKEKEEREMARRPGGGILNALARAGALADDTVPGPVSRLREPDGRPGTPSKADPVTSKAGPSTVKAEEEKKEQLPEPSDQKIQLLRSLLCICAIPEALYLLGRFSWLPDAFPDLPEHINRILHHSLTKVYAPLRPLAEREGIREAAKFPVADQSGFLKVQVKLTDAPTRKVLRWAQLDKNDQSEGTDYRFYWDDWADNVPVCQSVDDVFTLCNTLLNFSGIKIGHDPALLMKLARIGKHSLAEDSSASNRTRWIDLCKRLLCPALSLTRANPGVVNEVFDILKGFPTKVRYTVYAEWFTGQISRLPDIAAAFELARSETKDTMKRISKTNVKAMARTLAKVACASPGIVFGVVLHQIESYENFIDVVVECGRYFTYMGYDVLTWSLMSNLGAAGKSRIGANGMTADKWLLALATFTGRIFRRYSVMNTLPILQYILLQLHQGNFIDLVILKELIANMAGIASDTDFTDAQVQAMAGGELLQAQTLRQLNDKRHESKISARRLMKTLVDAGLTGPLLISIAQQRKMCIFNPLQSSLKVIGENFDAVQIMMNQYLALVLSMVSTEELDNLVPDLITLISEYGLDPDIAFAIHRRGIAKAVHAYDTTHKSAHAKPLSRVNEIKAQLDGVDDEDVVQLLVGEEVKPNTDTMDAATEGTKLKIDESMPDAVVPAESEVGIIDEARRSDTPQPRPWHPVLEDLMNKLRPRLAEGFESKMSLPFFVSFWQLSLHDLMAPYKSYTDEDNRQKDRIAAINADRTDMTVEGREKKERDKRSIADFQRKLLDEMKTHLANYSHVRDRLEVEKKHWFMGFSGKWKALNDAILQECFLPRMLASPLDSFFTWKMLNMLHSSGTPEFRTMHFLDRLLSEKMLTNLIFQCTGRQADNFGRFLDEVLKELSSWHTDKSMYEKRAYGVKKELPGFAQRFSSEGKPEKFLEFEDFRRLLYKWHLKIYNALRSCLKDPEYRKIRNAISVLRCIGKHFPVIAFQGKALCGDLMEVHKAESDIKELKAPDGRLLEEEKLGRSDLALSSISVYAQLNLRSEKWILPQAFQLNDAKIKEKAPGASSRAGPAVPKSPMPEKIATMTNLSATAPEFAPKGSTSDERKALAGGTLEVEDGEVEDAEMVDAKLQSPAALPALPASAVIDATNGPKDHQADLKAKALASFAARRQQAGATPNAEGKSITTESPAIAPASSTQAPSPVTSQPAKSTTARKEEGQPMPVSRPPLPPQSSIAIPTRPDMQRNSPASGAPQRPPHNLPDRPEARGGRYPPPRQQAERLAGTPNAPSDGRANGAHTAGEASRSDDLMRPKPDDRRGDLPGRFNGARHNDRVDRSRDRPREAAWANEPPQRQQGLDFAGRAPASHLGSSRDLAPGGRSEAEYPSRPDRRDGAPSRPDSTRQSDQSRMQPPNGSPQAPERGVPVNADRARMYGLGQPLDASEGRMQGRTADFVRDQDERREREPPTQAPDNRLSQTFPPRAEVRREELANTSRTSPTDSRPLSRDLATDRAPNGPRTGNHFTRGPPQLAESARPPIERPDQAGVARSVRQSQDFGRLGSQDVNYGRLNADSVPDQRQNVPQARPADNRHSYERPLGNGALPQMAPDHRRGPSGPAVSNRQDRGGDRSQNAIPSASPPTAALGPDMTGLHPSRMKEIFGENTRPPPLQTNVPARSAQPASTPSSAPPPSGPRFDIYQRQPLADNQSPTSAIPSSPSSARGPPTGPANTIDRTRQGARRFAGINDTLQKGGQAPPGPPTGPNDRGIRDQGASIRGRASGSRPGSSLAEGPSAPAANNSSPGFPRRSDTPHSGLPPLSSISQQQQQQQPSLLQQGQNRPQNSGARDEQPHRRDGLRSREDRGPPDRESDSRELRGSNAAGRQRTSREGSHDRPSRGSEGGGGDRGEHRDREKERERDGKDYPARSSARGGGDEDRTEKSDRRSERGNGGAERERERGRGHRGERDGETDRDRDRERERGDTGRGQGSESYRDGVREKERRDRGQASTNTALPPPPPAPPPPPLNAPLSNTAAPPREDFGYRGRRDGGDRGGGRVYDARKRSWAGDVGPGGGAPGIREGDGKRPRRGRGM